MGLRFYSWIAEARGESAWTAEGGLQRRRQQERRAEAVQGALERLAPVERVILQRHFWEGASLAEIALADGSRLERVLTQYRGALRRLERFLADFAKEEFGIEGIAERCVICAAPERAAIEALLATRRPGEGFRRVMAVLELRFGIRLVSKQTLVGHLKYHYRKGARG